MDLLIKYRNGHQKEELYQLPHDGVATDVKIPSEEISSQFHGRLGDEGGGVGL